MSLIKCPECGKEISSDAASCPHCGKNKQIPIGKRIVSFVMIVIATTIACAVLGMVGAFILIRIAEKPDLIEEGIPSGMYIGTVLGFLLGLWLAERKRQKGK